jgi:hypothetical protein
MIMGILLILVLGSLTTYTAAVDRVEMLLHELVEKEKPLKREGDVRSD